LVQIARESSAMHQLVRFPVNVREDFIIAAASEAGIRLISTRRYYASNSVRSEYLIAFAHEDEEPLRIAVEKFAEMVKPSVELRNS
jgi:DNA-binding transcriptional MocR family regulator